MNDEVFEKARQEDMYGQGRSRGLQELMDETGLDVDEAHELWQEL